MKTSNLLRFISFAIVIVVNVSFSSPKKEARLKLKADRLFDNFAYSKAVDLYEKVAVESEQLREESYLKIADSYRLMNKPLSAENWYQKLEGSSILTTQDRMNFAQVLLKNGKDHEAERIISKLNQDEISLINRLRNVDNIEIFFTDSSAYFVENMNINSVESDFSPAYFEEGIVFVSNRKNWRLNQSTYYWDDSYFLDLYYAKAEQDEVTSEPEPLTKRINTIFHEGPAAFYENDSKVIFTRNNFNLGEERTSVEGVNKLKLYYSEKGSNGKWEKPVALPFSDDNYSVGHPTITADGKTMFFAADLPGTVGKADIWKTELIDGQWGTPINLGDQVNTIENELFPFIDITGVLYFASEGHSGIGGLDIYKVDLKGSDLTPQNMGYPVNTKDDDFGMIFHGKEGYLSSNRAGGKGNDDIYKYTIYSYDMKARLVDSQSGETLSGNISVNRVHDNSEVVKGENTTDVAFSALRGHVFLLAGAVAGYTPNSFQFDSKQIPLEADDFVVDIPMTKVNRKGDILVVRNYNSADQVFAITDLGFKFFPGTKEMLEDTFKANYIDLVNTYLISSINYDFDKHNIRQDAKSKLDVLSEIMVSYIDVKVELASHTDTRGSVSYNERLSKRRAEAAKSYLIEKGIDESRLTIKYFGKEKPIACDGKDCDEALHERNRRTEIRIF